MSLNFRKLKVALNPPYRIFLNFAKSCMLSCLSKVDNVMKQMKRAVFELYAPTAVINGVFSRTYCCYGNRFCHENDNVSSNDSAVFCLK